MADIKIADQKQEADSQKNLSSSLKTDLEILQRDLQEKNRSITKLIESVRPFEDAVEKSESTINALNAKMDELQNTINTLNKEKNARDDSKGLLEQSNKALASKVAEKEATVNILKTRLNEQIELAGNFQEKLNRRESLYDTMKAKIQDQTTLIENVTKQLTEAKTQFNTIIETNKSSADKITEKEATIDILKQKIQEKTEMMKSLDEKNRRLEQDVYEAKKKSFAIENKLGSVEKRIYDGDERNQQIMAELLRSAERQKILDTMLAQKTQELDSIRQETAQQIQAERVASEEKRRMIMETHSRKLALMNAEIASLRMVVSQQKKAMSERNMKERDMIRVLSQRFGELASAKTDIPIPTSFADKYQEQPQEYAPATAEEPYQEAPEPNMMFDIPPPEEEKDEFKALISEPTYQGPSRIQEILPMIEVAMDHGDTPEQVKISLASTGYSEKEIEEAFGQLRVEN